MAAAAEVTQESIDDFVVVSEHLLMNHTHTHVRRHYFHPFLFFYIPAANPKRTPGAEPRRGERVGTPLVLSTSTFGTHACFVTIPLAVSLPTIQAARYGDMEDVQSYLSQGVSPDAVDVEGRTALFFAAANGHLEIVDVLLEKEAVSAVTTTMNTHTHTHLT